MSRSIFETYVTTMRPWQPYNISFVRTTIDIFSHNKVFDHAIRTNLFHKLNSNKQNVFFFKKDDHNLKS